MAKYEYKTKIARDDFPEAVSIKSGTVIFSVRLEKSFIISLKGMAKMRKNEVKSKSDQLALM